jgi:poly(hydroxyalkanoate) granule-associated protein
MAGKKGKTKQKDNETLVSEIGENLEHAFLAGLGALSNAQKKGAKTFDSLVKQGEDFRKKASKKTESLIDDVQDTIREMSDDAQDKATGLLDQVRGKAQLNKLTDAFDSRVSDAMDRLNVPSKNDIDDINRKLNKIIKLLGDEAKPAAKPAAKKKVAKKKIAKKKAAPKPVAKRTSTRKTTASTKAKKTETKVAA